ncbi:MAG: NepR family anti-sigma factor [Paracoccaceae bacterium]
MWQEMAREANERDAAGIRARIDENLKRVYQEALEEEVPDRFKLLLEELRKKEPPK